MSILVLIAGGVILYLAFAVFIGKFCGLNSRSERR